MSEIIYGDFFVGEWLCLGCKLRLFPRQAREKKLQYSCKQPKEWHARTLTCPDCKSHMVYDEAA